MIKIEALTLEEAYSQAATKLECSVTELKIEVVQVPSKGILGLFKKSAVIVAAVDVQKTFIKLEDEKPSVEKSVEVKPKKSPKKQKNQEKPKEKPAAKTSLQNVYNDTIMPQSFVSTQDDDGYDDDYIDDEIDEESYEEIINEVEEEEAQDINEIVIEVREDINKLFKNICFDIDEIIVSAYDDNTLLLEFSGTDAALLIGKEGYRYKALS